MKGLFIVILIIFCAWSAVVFNYRASDAYQYYHSYKFLNEYEKELKDEYTEVVEGTITHYSSIDSEKSVVREDKEYFIIYEFQVKDETYKFDSDIRYENLDVTDPFLVYYKKYFPEKNYTSEDVIKAKENLESTENIVHFVSDILFSLGVSIVIGKVLYLLFRDVEGEKNNYILNKIMIFSYILIGLGLLF